MGIRHCKRGKKVGKRRDDVALEAGATQRYAYACSTGGTTGVGGGGEHGDSKQCAT